jgi:hypothetical protein
MKELNNKKRGLTPGCVVQRSLPELDKAIDM